MLPMRALRLKLGSLLAADASTLAPAVDPNVIALIMSPFTLTENLVVGDLTLATFTGATPIEGATGAQAVGIDPTTLAQIIEIKPPLGGYRWITGDTVNLPQTIYGYALLKNDLSVLLAATVFQAGITLQDAGQFIAVDPVTMQFVAQPLS